MLGTSLTKYFKITEWILYLGLCILSAYFMEGVLDKYFSEKTSFTQSEEPIEDAPVITICFTESEYEYGSDFILEYGFHIGEVFHSIILKAGESLTLLEKDVYLEKLTTLNFGNCYKISSKSPPITKIFAQISLHFNEAVMSTDLQFKLKVFITSEKNSYGVAANAWLNGRIVKMDIEKEISKTVDLKPEKYDYLTSRNCSHESFYECFSRLYQEKLKLYSMIECSPITLPRLPMCKLNELNHKEFVALSWEVLKEIQENTKCPKLCSTLGYYGEITSEPNIWNSTFSFGYGFASSNTLREYKEYYIYDVISMIGSVGGTLGMCVGFSFTGVISCLFNRIYKRIGIESSKLQPFNEHQKDVVKMKARINEHEKLLKIILNKIDLS